MEEDDGHLNHLYVKASNRVEYLKLWLFRPIYFSNHFWKFFDAFSQNVVRCHQMEVDVSNKALMRPHVLATTLLDLGPFGSKVEKLNECDRS